MIDCQDAMRSRNIRSQRVLQSASALSQRERCLGRFHQVQELRTAACSPKASYTSACDPGLLPSVPAGAPMCQSPSLHGPGPRLAGHQFDLHTGDLLRSG